MATGALAQERRGKVPQRQGGLGPHLAPVLGVKVATRVHEVREGLRPPIARAVLADVPWKAECGCLNGASLFPANPPPLTPYRHQPSVLCAFTLNTCPGREQFPTASCLQGFQTDVFMLLKSGPFKPRPNQTPFRGAAQRPCSEGPGRHLSRCSSLRAHSGLRLLPSHPYPRAFLPPSLPLGSWPCLLLPCLCHAHSGALGCGAGASP